MDCFKRLEVSTDRTARYLPFLPSFHVVGTTQAELVKAANSGHPPADRTKMGKMIRQCSADDFEAIWEIINDGARAYKGVIPEDRWKEPYMTRDELRHEMAEGVGFWGLEQDGELSGVMGIQAVKDVTLIRHAYIRTDRQKSGIGAKLLTHLLSLTNTPVLIGTWAAATWAIRFYEKNGFRQVEEQEKNRLLKKYWTVPEEQIATSVVLADGKTLGDGQTA
jgi:N-acetylglutamate synthase-like GNAT family acetyltransferase